MALEQPRRSCRDPRKGLGLARGRLAGHAAPHEFGHRRGLRRFGRRAGRLQWLSQGTSLRPMASRPVELVRRFWGVPYPERAYRLALIALLGLGIGLRLVGYLGHPIALWEDEAFWARRLIHRNLLELTIRPVGFMWLSRQLVRAFGPSEFWLRFLPNLASHGTLLLAPYVASQLFAPRWARLLLVFLFALNPALIDLAKEFKPYSVEAFAHMSLLALYLRYRQLGRRRYLFGLLVLMPALLPFAYVTSFAYPGLLLLVLWRGWANKRRSLVIGAFACGIACVGALGFVYSLTFHRLDSAKAEKYWGKKYDVFYVERSSKTDDPGRTAWTLEKYGDLASLPGLRRERWRSAGGSADTLDTLRDIDRSLWITLHVLGLAYLLIRRRVEVLMLLCLPLLAVVTANLLGRWPLGLFRVNLFLCPYVLPIPVFGLVLLAGARRWRERSVAVAASLLCVVPTFGFGFDWHRTKETWTRSHYMPELLAVLRQQRQLHLRENRRYPPETLVLDNSTLRSYVYYLDVHPSSKEQNRAFFRANFRMVQEPGALSRIERHLARRLKQSKRPIWLLSSKHPYMDPLERYARQIGNVVFERRIGTDHMVLEVAPK